MTTRKIGLHLEYGGNPPDAGTLYYSRTRVAFLPVDRIKTLTLQQAQALLDEWIARGQGEPLNRADVDTMLNQRRS